ncbi:N-acetylglucosamine kinase [Alicyclobacillus sp. SO9]|uniref:N-acetylglucosamine kinase n=1 Tax=Alicyclobacillus sp. SO9 TaxID=2665646 RepID=UPI0018E75467|nr:BadF/BadG/BcrA/BcrD ATPase family protein [Alicyclobacillus sp. SO9]QQE77482.1 ATPase [Alicyclobacillus sp. SO9]
MLVGAVDGGGTKTKAVIGDDSCTILSEATAGCGNHQVCGVQQSVTNVGLALQTALAKLGKSERDVTYVHYSLAGADRPEDMDLLRDPLQNLGFARWGLTSDAWSSLRLGTDQGNGIGIVCGTGTNAVGRNAFGNEIQVGGFGYLLGDRAGGEALARCAFHTAVRSFEGREEKSLLTELLPLSFGKDNMMDLIQLALDEGWETVPASLAEIVHSAADQGDVVSISLLQNMGLELGNAAVAVFRKLGGWPAGVVVPVVLTGSIVQSGRNKDLLAKLESVVTQSIPNADLRIPTFSPVMGALMTACDSVGLNGLSPAWDRVSDILNKH